MAILNSMMLAASAQLGTLANRWQPSARSHKSKSGPFASTFIEKDASGTVPCSL